MSAQTTKADTYREVRQRIDALLVGETDLVAAMATVVCELHHAFEHYDWTGFYRTVEHESLAVGPYQGGHGCLRIAFGKGVCGTAAATKTTQLVPDVDAFPGHIACSSTTRSEIVVPVIGRDDSVIAVFDVDSNQPDAFDKDDQEHLEAICQMVGQRFS